MVFSWSTTLVASTTKPPRGCAARKHRDNLKNASEFAGHCFFRGRGRYRYRGRFLPFCIRQVPRKQHTPLADSGFSWPNAIPISFSTPIPIPTPILSVFLCLSLSANESLCELGALCGKENESTTQRSPDSLWPSVFPLAPWRLGGSLPQQPQRVNLSLIHI